MPRGIELKRPSQLAAMRRSGLVVARTLDRVRSAAAPGVTTGQLDEVARSCLAEAGAGSSFLGYGVAYGVPAYPAVTCISVNDEVVHGIPGDRVLAAGDLVSVDFGAYLAGWHGDSAVTFGVGEISPEAAVLSEVTREAMWQGIAAARYGGHIGDISAAVEAAVRSAGGFGIVAEYTGHGIGTAMHQAPDVPNVRHGGRGARLADGICLAIEPMVTAGSADTRTLADEWTVVTRDGGWAAHWEHTVAITKAGLFVLTAEDGGEAELTARGAKFAPLSGR